MTAVTIDGLITTTEDTGTGVPTATEDWTSAGHVAGMHSKQNTKHYVESGLRFTVDWSVPEATISAGLTHVFHPETIQVQNNDGDYNYDWDEGVTFTNQVPEVSGITLTDNEVNAIWLSLVLTENNDANYVVEPASAEPAHPKIKIGEIDTEEQTTSLANRNPETRSKTSSVQQTIEGADSAEIPENYAQAIPEPYNVEGDLDVEGVLDVIGKNPTPKRHEHGGDVLTPLGVAAQNWVPSWQEIVIPSGHSMVATSGFTVEEGGELVVEKGGELKVV